MSATRVYPDGDLAALAWSRELFEAPPPPLSSDEPGAGWRGRLAELWTAEETLPKPVLKGLLGVLAKAGRPCPCGWVISLLPAPSAREVACPRCGHAHVVAADPDGVPQLPGWTPRPSGHSTMRVAAPEARSGPGSTLRTAPETGGSGRPGARSDPSYSERGQREKSPSATNRDQGATARDSKASTAGGGLPFLRLGPGDRVGPYVVESELSRGAMGIVLRAYPEGLPEQRVALKVLQARVSDEEGRIRFQREAEAMARLSHPAVVKVHRLDLLPDGNPYLAMELVEGQDLEQSVGSEPVEIPEAARLVAGVAAGVAHLHSRGLIHRDLKLANVLLREGREPVVADFGLVHFLDRQTRLTQVGDLVGTPLYMSPELVRGEVGITAAADVYALGVMLYRLVAGRYPHECETTPELLAAILDEEPILDPSWPAPLRAVLGKALAYEPEARYPDAGALEADARALHEGRGVSVRPPGIGRKLARLRRGLAKRPRLIRALGVLAVSAPLVASGLFVHEWRLEARAREGAREVEQEANALLVELEEGQAKAVRWEPIRARLEGLVETLPPDEALVGRLEAVRLELDQSVARAALLDALSGDESLVELAERAAALPLPTDPTPARAAAFCAARLELRFRTGDLEGALKDRSALGEPSGEGESVRRLRTFYRSLERAQGKTPAAPDALTAARWALDSARIEPAGPARAKSLVAARLLLEAAQAGPSAVAAADPPAPPRADLHAEGRKLLRFLPPPIEDVPRLEPEVAERALLAIRAEALALPPGDPNASGLRSVLIERLRRLRRDPRRALPPGLEARSLVLEARLALELGWVELSLEAWGRARATWSAQRGAFSLAPSPALGGQAPALLPFALVARVGEVRAASEGLDPEPLRRAAEVLGGEVAGGTYATWRAEAEALAAPPGERPNTPAGQRLAALDAAAERASPQAKGPVSTAALRDLYLGEGELAAAGRALWHEREFELGLRLDRTEGRLGRALQRGLPLAETARAWAARVLLAVRRAQLDPGALKPADLDAARLDLARAKGHQTTAWEVKWAEAALASLEARGGQGSSEDVARRYLGAAAAAGASHEIPLVGFGRRHEVLVDGLLAIRVLSARAAQAGGLPARVLLLEALVALSREVPLQPHDQGQWLERLGEELQAAGETARAAEVAQARALVAERQQDLKKRQETLLRYQIERPDMGSVLEKELNWKLILDYPLAIGALFDDYQRHRPLTQYADDSLGVAFAVRPLYVARKLCGEITYATITRKSAHLGAPVAATRATRRLKEFGPPNPLQLKVAPPPELLKALLHFEQLAMGEELDPSVRSGALEALDAALQESPRSQAVALLEAWVRSNLGDSVGARRALERARWLGSTCRPPRDTFEAALVPHFIRARSFAVEGSYEQAVAALRPLRTKRQLTSEWLYWERDFRIQRERWGAFPPALIRVYLSLLKEEEEERRRR